MKWVHNYKDAIHDVGSNEDDNETDEKEKSDAKQDNNDDVKKFSINEENEDGKKEENTEKDDEKDKDVNNSKFFNHSQGESEMVEIYFYVTCMDQLLYTQKLAV